MVPLGPKNLRVPYVMLTIYAKSLSGDITTLSVSTFQTWNAIHTTLAERVCSYDPSRLVLLPDPEVESKSDAEEEETADPNWGVLREWKDGDSVSYFVKDPVPFQIRYSRYLCKLTEEYDHTKAPYYTIHVYIEPLDRDQSVYPSECLYQYQFLYSMRDNQFIHSSDYTLEDDEYGPILSISDEATRWTSLYDMLEMDETIPSCFRYAMYRSAYRKWSDTLWSVSRPIKAFPRRKMTKVVKEMMEERKTFLEIYKQFRSTRPPYVRKTE